MKREKKKKKTPQSKRKAASRRGVRSSEIMGVLLIFLALFLVISLISYDAQDPSWATSTASGLKVHNFGGRVGASLAEALYQFFGLTALLFPLALLTLSIPLILPRRRKRLFLKTSTGIVFG